MKEVREQTPHGFQEEQRARAGAWRQEEQQWRKQGEGRVGVGDALRPEREAGWVSCVGGCKDVGVFSG